MPSGLDFTTIARARRACGFDEQDLSADAWLAVMISTVSAEMEEEMRRGAKEQAYTEILPLWPPTKILSLKGSPVLDSPAPVVELANDRDFATSPTTLTRGTDYILENDTGMLRFLTEIRGVRDRYTGRVVGPTYVKAVYTGGMGATPQAFATAFPHLASACDLQVAYMWKRREMPGGNVVVGANSTNYDMGYNWLPSVKRVLHLHKKRGIY